MLKKTAAILVLGMFMFNWFGYRVFTSMLQYMANASLEERLDSDNYQESELISIKIPASLPYYVNSPDYDRVNGEITIEGKHYNFVKRRLFNDSLEYLCIPNEQRKKLDLASDEFHKQVNDLQHPSQKEKAGNNYITVKNLLAEYCQQISPAYAHDYYINIVKTHAPYSLVALLDPALSCAGEPPEA